MQHAARNLIAVLFLIFLIAPAPQVAQPAVEKPKRKSETPQANPVTPPMTVWQARRAVITGLNTVLPHAFTQVSFFHVTGYEVKMNPESIRVSAGRIECEADVSDFYNNGTTKTPRNEHCKVDLRSIGTLGFERLSNYYWLTENEKRDLDGLLAYIAWGAPAEAQAFADAVNRLRSSARGERTPADEADWREFQQKAAEWRALAVKPSITEDVRKHRLLAENAVNEKQFDNAVEEYEAGLKISPVWPEGHFNAALLCAELEYYSEAIHHMQAYLELVPEAPDAQQARDQMVIWEAKLAKAK